MMKTIPLLLLNESKDEGEKKSVSVVEFMYLVFTVITRMPGKSYCRWLRSLSLHLCDVFWVLINFSVCWLFKDDDVDESEADDIAEKRCRRSESAATGACWSAWGWSCRASRCLLCHSWTSRWPSSWQPSPYPSPWPSNPPTAREGAFNTNFLLLLSHWGCLWVHPGHQTHQH